MRRLRLLGVAVLAEVMPIVLLVRVVAVFGPSTAVPWFVNVALANLGVV